MNLVCYLSNFLALGIETTDAKAGGWVRNKICLSVAGLAIEIHQEPDFINAKKSDLKGQFIESTKLVVKGIKEQDVEHVVDVVQKISVLLSFAICSEVRFYSWNIEGTNKSHVWNVRGAYHYFRPPFCCANSSHIKQLVEYSFDTYSEIYEKRALNVVVDLLNTPEVKNLQIELKLATLFVLLENLKSSYAKSKSYKYKSGYYWTSSNEKYYFKTLLQEMFESVSMEVSLTEIKNLRNEIVHSGLSHLSHDEQFSIYATCRDIVTEYFLRLIKYKGSFDTYESRCMRSKEIA
ncbi:hypothetical protein [Marinagarivorans cellulosilyticus]|uniref:Apea-like HEPN domain-containing protein n=1 Tax=Marinagarivorans cellulosilyticus TaxID=2721545 RepID=A0AAN1WE47_9GAMM|nr:hypothetical protein [Marinagarivorans cellulosilyticus]BCD95907.1 hypothetical protein MARGE09_P0106 [Marinagarivorans cellulosilyticus]